MRIAITGATGFVGAHVAQRARAAGHEVIALSRAPRDDSRFDGMRRFALEAPPDLSGCDAVIHLAGESVTGLWTPAKRARIRHSRIEGTRRVVEGLAAGNGPRVLVSASAIGFYGDTGETIVDETAPAGSGFLAEVAQAWEAEALQAQRHGVRVVILRIGVVLGCGGGALAVLRPIFRCGLGGRLGNGRQWLSWIHLDDLSALLLEAATRPSANGVYNAVAPQPVRNVDFTAQLARACHRPAVLRVPGFVLRSLLGDFAGEVLGSRRVVPRRLLESGYKFAHPDIGPALQQLCTLPH